MCPSDYGEPGPLYVGEGWLSAGAPCMQDRLFFMSCFSVSIQIPCFLAS